MRFDATLRPVSGRACLDPRARSSYTSDMSTPSVAGSCPLARRRVVDLYFMEHRAKLLDLAAFLDRIDRARDDGTGEDFRIDALRRATGLLFDGDGERTRRILDLFSDPGTEPIPAAGVKGADGAFNPASRSDPRPGAGA